MAVLVNLLFAGLTFPGIIVHEFSHKIICDLFSIKIFEIKYFQFKNPTGYIHRENTDTFFQALLICLSPILLNSVLGFMSLFLWKIISLDTFFSDYSIFGFFFQWLGFSIILYSFPSSDDCDNLRTVSLKYKPKTRFVFIIGIFISTTFKTLSKLQSVLGLLYYYLMTVYVHYLVTGVVYFYTI